MGEAELKAALQREADARVRDFWKEAEERVVARRREVKTERSRTEAETEQQRMAAIASVRDEILITAQQAAADVRLQAESLMCDRLLALAETLLPELARTRRAALWTAFAEELPDLAWHEIRVCAEQRVAAEEIFPAASVVVDQALGGGLVASSADGRVTIDNSLRCRLLRAWPDLLPELMNSLRSRVTDDETAGSKTSC